jgi:hypothetical protein
MKRFRLVTIAVAGILGLAAYSAPLGMAKLAGSRAAVSSAQATFLSYHEPLCQSRVSLCTEPGFTTQLLFNNFNSGDIPNPCPVG